MERIESVNPDRVAWCCADRGITLEQLAPESGVSLASLHRLMAGEGGLTFNQLRSIADYFGRGVLFFLEDTPVFSEQVHTPQFRTLANHKPELSPKLKSLIERVEKHRDFYLSLREELDEGDYPRFVPPAINNTKPVEAAEIARQWLRLGHENAFDTYRAAVEACGVLVFRSNGYNGKWQIAKESSILGFSLYDPICPVIVVKKLDWEPRQSFTLLHELGHILIHKASSIDDEQDLQSHEGDERDANSFAGHVLVPDSFLLGINDATRPHEVSAFDSWLEQQRRAWGVSGEVILRRLLDAGRLPQNRYEEYRQWRNEYHVAKDESGNRQYRHREPRHIFGDQYVRTVLDSLDARNITLAKASTYLDSLKIKDLRQLERFYAGL
jgi:Zn-dependent peptidase ImmA (M78 family)